MIDAIRLIKDRIQGKAPHGLRRDPGWRVLRKEHLEKHPECFVCKSTRKVEVHHIVPFHVAPDQELNPENLITLCENGRFKALNCHLLIGHLGNYRNININCVEDAMVWRGRLNK
jgi:hypothetical protein